MSGLFGSTVLDTEKLKVDWLYLFDFREGQYYRDSLMASEHNRVYKRRGV